MTKDLLPLLVLMGVSLVAPAGAADAPAAVLAPDCALTDLDGAMSFTLGALRGKVVYVDFWASWCIPCRDAFPFMNSIDEEFKVQQLQVLAVNLDDEVVDARRFLERFPASFRVAADPAKSCSVAFGVRGMPTSFLVDRAGHVRLLHRGFRPGDARALREAIRSLLAEPQA